MARRREMVFEFGNSKEGVRLIVTRSGIELSGHYDSMVGIEGGTLSWAELTAAHEEVKRVEPKGVERHDPRPTASPHPAPDAGGLPRHLGR